MVDQETTEWLRPFGDLVHVHLAELTAGLCAEIAQSIEAIPSDPVMSDLLSISVEGNLDMIAQVLRVGIEPEDAATPAGASQFARRLAQNGVPPNALLRAYRVGQRMFDEWAFERIVDDVADAHHALSTYHVLAQTVHRYIDTISERVFLEYQEERDRWLSERSTVRAEVIERLIAGDHLQVEAAEAALGHRLAQEHLGLILWHARPSTHGAELTVLEQVATRLCRNAGVDAAPLFWPKDRNTAWVWIPLGRGREGEADLDWGQALEAVDSQVRVAAGRSASGADGFRITHLEAQLAQRVALLGGERSAHITSYSDVDVRAVSLLTEDLDRARRLVSRALGELARDNEPNQRLRETLQVFLEENGSFVATGKRLNLHKNSVKYRIDRAVESRGRPVTEDRFDLELALMASHRIDRAVLLPDAD